MTIRNSVTRTIASSILALALGSTAISSAGAATPFLSSSTAPTETNVMEAGDSEQVELSVESEHDLGYIAHIQNGSLTENHDGTVSVADADNQEVSTLRTEIPLRGGEVASIDYEVDGNELRATFDKAVNAETLHIPEPRMQTACNHSAGIIGTGGAAAAAIITAATGQWWLTAASVATLYAQADDYSYSCFE